MRLVIHSNPRIFTHSTAWNSEWISYCEDNRISYVTLDLFRPEALRSLQPGDAILWHLNNYSPQEMIFARSILRSIREMGMRVFPDDSTAWHFDDKVAQGFLLDSVHAPVPDWWFFVNRDECTDWLSESAVFPIVAKLRTGSGSQNVQLLQNHSDAVAYANRMFDKGVQSTPNLAFKAWSNLNSSRSFSTLKNRAMRAPEFFRTRRIARSLPREQGYAYFQEFIPNEGFDLKIVVVNDKLSFIVRDVRSHDFRASGGGRLSFDPRLVPSGVIENAFETSAVLRFQCMGYDYVVDSRDGHGRIIEVSYGFSHAALLLAGGYWSPDGLWHAEPLNAPIEVVRMLLASSP